MMNYPFLPLNMRLTNWRALLWSAAFIGGNLALPYACHYSALGNLGYALLPIYFFTLISAYKFGWRIGLLTAVCSPLLNNLLLGMPSFEALPIILAKSAILAMLAALAARIWRSKISILHILAVVAAYQIIGSAIEAIIYNADTALNEFRFGWIGMLVQIFGGYIVLRILARYD
jgi:hypothetical protein